MLKNVVNFLLGVSQSSNCSAFLSHEAAALFKRNGALLVLKTLKITFSDGIQGTKKSRWSIRQTRPLFKHYCCSCLQTVHYSLHLFLSNYFHVTVACTPLMDVSD